MGCFFALFTLWMHVHHTEYARNFVQGMQGNNEEYLKTSASCKHYAGYSMEYNRYAFNEIISDVDMNETYLPAFANGCVKEGETPFLLAKNTILSFSSCIIGGASSLMCSFSSVNGVPSCGNKWLMNDVARETWGFDVKSLLSFVVVSVQEFLE